jgi:drug/metabolite transporter (DMT)-like permease
MYLLFSERLTLKKWLGILLGFTGSLVIILSNSAMDTHELLGVSLAELAALGSIIVSRFGWIKIQQLLKSHAFNVKEINGITMFCAGIYSLISTLIFTPQAFYAPLDWYNLSLLAYTIVGGNIIGYQLYSHLLKKHSATFVTLAGMTTPLFVYLLGWLIVGEKLYTGFWISSAITLAGLLVFYQEELKEALA